MPVRFYHYMFRVTLFLVVGYIVIDAASVQPQALLGAIVTCATVLFVSLHIQD